MSDINNITLSGVGFTKQFPDRKNGFHHLQVTEEIHFTVGFDNMKLSIHKKGYGHIETLDHITTMKQIIDLYHLLSGKNLMDLSISKFVPQSSDDEPL